MPATKIITAIKMAPLRLSQINVLGSLIAVPQLRWVAPPIAQVARSGNRDSSLAFFAQSTAVAPSYQRLLFTVEADTLYRKASILFGDDLQSHNERSLNSI